MRILLINDYATATAGAEIMALHLRDELRRRGHDVRVFASRAQLIAGELFADYDCFGTVSRWQAVVSTWNPSARRRLREALRAFRPDLVHVKMFLWQLSPAILPLLKGTPCVYHAVTYKAVCPRGTRMLPDGSRCTFTAGGACLGQGCLTPQSWILMMAQRKLLRRWRSVFRAVIANSESTRARLIEDGIGPVEVIANGTPLRKARPPLSGPPVLAYAGRLSPEKGVDTLLRAFAQMRDTAPDARLWIAGTGPQGAQLRRLAEQTGAAPRVDFLGALTREALERRFEAAWVQIVPSRWDEPFGIVAIEAMMRGTAVIASDGGGLGEIVRPEVTGLLVPPGDVSALAGALRRLANDRAACERFGETGRQVALKDYTVAAHVDQVEALHRRLVERHRSDG